MAGRACPSCSFLLPEQWLGGGCTTALAKTLECRLGDINVCGSTRQVVVHLLADAVLVQHICDATRQQTKRGLGDRKCLANLVTYCVVPGGKAGVSLSFLESE